MKTLLIIVDGMRADALLQIKEAEGILQKSFCTVAAQTVMPSVTLPCHMSLFHSVDPSRHGTTINTYSPQVRPIKGLCEVLSSAQKSCAFFYNWEQLRDLARPGNVDHACFYSGKRFGYDKANDMVADAAISYLTSTDTDFAFVFFGYPDDAGHRCGWMSEQYMKALQNSWCNIGRLIEALPEEYAVIITADHGGHDRMHGTDLPEDMTIPMVFFYKGEKHAVDLTDANIKDLAPTIAALLGVSSDEEWEGKNLLA